MVTAYYIMKMSQKNKSLDIYDYYNNLVINELKKFRKNSLTCRVCLKDGSLPIHSGERSLEIIEALQIFGDIVSNENDGKPKHLCMNCHKFLKCAISFRKIAKEANNVLKQSVKVESFDKFEDSHDDAEEFDIKVSETYKIKNDSIETIKRPLRREREQGKMKKVKVQCPECNKIVTSSYYKEHMTMHDPNHQKYVCDVCGRSFRLRCSYHNHRLRHRTDFAFKCQFCPYKGRYKELLKTHMRTHSGDYRYMCTECPGRFLFKSNLNRHILIKHKEPQHKCEVCKRAFHTKIMVEKHHEVDHLGIKNHTCNICGKAFGYRNAMMKHQRRVHKREKLLFSRMPTYLQVEEKNKITNVT